MPVSAWRLRSWNSSKRTIAYELSAGSCWSRRPRVPSVTTSILVLGPTFVSSLMRYPTVPPTDSPSVVAMRWAAARAASRRGSSMSSFLSASHGASSKASGTRVVFPAPGAAVSSAFRPSVIVRRRVGNTSSIESLDMIGSAVTRQTVSDQCTHEKDRGEWQAIKGPRRNLAPPVGTDSEAGA